MERSLALLVVAVVCGAVLAAAEVPVHMTASEPLALQRADAEERFAEQHADVEGDEVVAHNVDHVEATPHVPSDRDGFVSEGVVPPAKAPWKAPGGFARETAAADRLLSKAEEKELLKSDSVIDESTNTMTQSAKCLMHCANGYGLCTRTNSRGCACAAGCMCNRGEAEASCAQHCHPDNQMNFVYGYHDADHFSPHFWGKSIGDVMSDYQHVRACLAGCAKRGKCKPRFCPRHPSGGYKCDECNRLRVVPASHRRGEKRYYLVEKAKAYPHIHRVTRTAHTHNHIDEWGHIVRHTHTHTHHSHAYPYPRFAEQHAEVEAEAEAEAETESGAEAEAQAEEGMEVHMEADAGAEQMVEADVAMAAQSDAEMEAEAQAEATDGYVHIVRTPFVQSVTADASNIRRYAPRTVVAEGVRPVNGEDLADNYPVVAAIPQDPLAKKIDCNYYDCTGLQSEPYVPAGSLNPVEPYAWKADTRTTTFSTVPDMLEPRAELKTVYVH